MNLIIKKVFILGLFSLFSLFISTSNAAEDKLAEAFFSMPDMTMAKVSPNGKHIAAIRYQGKKQNIVLIDSSNLAETLLVDLSGVFKKKSTISELVWIDNQHIAAQLVEVKKGVEELLDTKQSRRLLVIKTPNANTPKTQIYSVRTNGWLVHPLPLEQGTFLYAKSSIYSKVYKLNVNKLAIEGKRLGKLSKIDGGQFKKSNEVAEITGFATRWFIDDKGEVIAALHYNEKQELTLSALQEEDNSVLKTWPKETTDVEDETIEAEILGKKLVPIALAEQSDSFYCLDLNEDEERTVYRVNYTSGKEEVVYEAESFKIVNIVLSPKTRKLTSVKILNDGAIETVFINDEQQNTSKNQSNKIELVSVVNQNIDLNTAIIYTESHNNAGQFFLKNKNGKRLIGERFPQLKNTLASQIIESHITVQGLDIPYILSLPKSNSSKPYPLIVMPHGGPIGVYDHHYYNAIVQYLVANKYAVLQVNFRGSSGYSRELKESGKKQWGKLMLEDIYQATKASVVRADINAERVCAFGMSYGGYASLMLTIEHPEIFKCAANWAGVTDINLYLNSPRLNKKQKQWTKEYVGNSYEDYQALQTQSPAYRVKELTTPVLIAHGYKDEIVDIEHAYRMKLMLDKYNKPYQWFIDEEGQHSFGSLEQRQTFFILLNDFLKQHI